MVRGTAVSEEKVDGGDPHLAVESDLAPSLQGELAMATFCSLVVVVGFRPRGEGHRADIRTWKLSDIRIRHDNIGTT